VNERATTEASGIVRFIENPAFHDEDPMRMSRSVMGAASP
jgi:hypothetical protein